MIIDARAGFCGTFADAMAHEPSRAGFSAPLVCSKEALIALIMSENSSACQHARYAQIKRGTAETSIAITVNLDGTGAYTVSTGIGFLDHMVEQFSKHSLIDVEMAVNGDLHVDQHHTTEDSAIALGQAIADALGDKAGIGRYGHAYSPMDETLTRVALDISGRPYFVWKAGFTQEKLGEWDTELIEHWFHSVSQSAGLTLHMELLYGSNNHHICESLYKGFARAMRVAVERDPRKGESVPSTKGMLGG